MQLFSEQLVSIEISFLMPTRIVTADVRLLDIELKIISHENGKQLLWDLTKRKSEMKFHSASIPKKCLLWETLKGNHRKKGVR